MSALVVYEIPSRRLLQRKAIPWAEPAPVVAVPYPSFLRPKLHRIKGLERTLLTTPSSDGFFVEASTFLPAWTAKAANKSVFNRHLRLVPKLDSYPPTPAAEQPLTAYLAPEQFKQSQTRNLLRPLEVDTYPATPPTPEQPLTAFMRPKLFSRHGRTVERRVQELDDYPESAATADCVTGVESRIDDSVVGVECRINPNGASVTSTIEEYTGVESTIDDTNASVRCKIDPNGESVESRICQ